MFGITKENGTYSVEVGTVTITNVKSIWEAIDIKIIGYQLPVRPYPYTDNNKQRTDKMENAGLILLLLALALYALNNQLPVRPYPYTDNNNERTNKMVKVEFEYGEEELFATVEEAQAVVDEVNECEGGTFAWIVVEYVGKFSDPMFDDDPASWVAKQF